MHARSAADGTRFFKRPRIRGQIPLPGDGERRTRTADTSIFSRGATCPTRRANRSKRRTFAGISCESPATVDCRAACRDTRGYRRMPGGLGLWAVSVGPNPNGRVKRMARPGLEPGTPRFSVVGRPARPAVRIVAKRRTFAGISCGLPRRWTAALPAEIPADTVGCRGVWAYGRCPSAQTQTGGSSAWREADSNRRHLDFQSSALPAELSRRDGRSYRLARPSDELAALPQPTPI